MTLMSNPQSRFIREHSLRARSLASDIELAMSTMPDGFTLSNYPRGRSFWPIQNLVSPPTGFAVGGIIPSLVITYNPRSYTPTIDKLASWAEKFLTLADVLSDTLYVGGWLDGTMDGTPTMYVDAVLIVPDREKALAFAKMNGEKAIGYIVNGEYQETINVE